MKQIKHAVIMAAGRGTRMIPLTNEIPKAMAKYGDSTLIVNGIEKIKPIINHLHITVGYKKAKLAQHVIEHQVDTIINTEGKGNAWWIFNSLLKFLDEPVFVLTCDNVIDLDFEALSIDYHNLGEPACMVVPVKPIAGIEGDFIFEENNIVKELKRNQSSDKYCSGIQIIHPAKVNQLIEHCDDFNLLWEGLIAKQEVYCSNVFPRKWYTVDTMDQLNQLNQLDS